MIFRLVIKIGCITKVFIFYFSYNTEDLDLLNLCLDLMYANFPYYSLTTTWEEAENGLFDELVGLRGVEIARKIKIGQGVLRVHIQAAFAWLRVKLWSIPDGLTFQVFRNSFPELEGRGELRALFEYAVWGVHLVGFVKRKIKGPFVAKTNVTILRKVCATLSEGAYAREYVSGGGATLATLDRSMIIEKLGGVKKFVRTGVGKPHSQTPPRPTTNSFINLDAPVVIINQGGRSSRSKSRKKEELLPDRRNSRRNPESQIMEEEAAPWTTSSSKLKNKGTTKRQRKKKRSRRSSFEDKRDAANVLMHLRSSPIPTSNSSPSSFSSSDPFKHSPSPSSSSMEDFDLLSPSLKRQRSGSGVAVFLDGVAREVSTFIGPYPVEGDMIRHKIRELHTHLQSLEDRLLPPNYEEAMGIDS